MKHFLMVRVLEHVSCQNKVERLPVPKHSCMEFCKLTTTVSFLIYGVLFLSSSFSPFIWLSLFFFPLCLYFIPFLHFSSFSVFITLLHRASTLFLWSWDALTTVGMAVSVIMLLLLLLSSLTLSYCGDSHEVCSEVKYVV